MEREEQIDTTGEGAVQTEEPKKTGSKKTDPKPKPKPMQLISFTEFRAATDRKITFVLTQGFTVWMREEKKEPLRARTFSDWDKLIEEYLKS